MSEAPLAPAARARILVPFALVTLIWGSTWLAIQYQMTSVPAEWSIVYRFAIAATVMFAVARIMSGGIALDARAHGLAFMIGAMQFAGNYQFVYAAERHIASGLVAVVSASMLVSNAVLARIFLGQQISRPFLLGSAVALAGIGLLFAHELGADGAGHAAIVTGVALTVGGLLCASVANVLQATEGSRRIHAARLLAWGMLYGTLIDTLIAIARHGAPVFDSRASYVVPLLYLALAGSALTFTLYLGIIRAIGPARAAYSSVLTPVIAMALSTMFEDYRWSPTAAAGAVLTLAGLVFALRARSPAR